MLLPSHSVVMKYRMTESIKLKQIRAGLFPCDGCDSSNVIILVQSETLTMGGIKNKNSITFLKKCDTIQGSTEMKETLKTKIKFSVLSI